MIMPAADRSRALRKVLRTIRGAAGVPGVLDSISYKKGLSH